MADVTTSRLHGLDVTAVTIGTVVEFLHIFQNMTLEVETETQESRAVQDDWAYATAKHKSWRLTGWLSVDTGATYGITYPDELQTKFAGPVAVSFNTGGGGTYTGNGILRRISHTTPDGGQTQDIEITGVGELLFT